MGTPAIDRVWALPLWSTLGCSLSLSEFGRSRNGVWALLDGDDLYLSAYVCWVVSIIRHSGFYAQPRARTHELQVNLAETGSGIVEAACPQTTLRIYVRYYL